MVLGVAGLGLFIVKTIFTEDLYTSRYSPAYFITITSKTIKNVSIINAIEKPVFYYSCGDGPKLPANGIIYKSNKPPKDLLTQIENYIKTEDYILEDDVSNNKAIVKRYKKKEIMLTIEIISGEQTVSVTEYYL